MRRNASVKREQRLVAAILLVSVAGSLCLLLLGTLPLRAKKNELLAQKVRLERQPADALGGPPLEQQVMAEQAMHAALVAEWERLLATVQTFGEGAQPTNFMSVARESRIDFKIELANVRQRLAAEAQRIGAVIPQNLGLVETISAIDDAEERFWQLAATDKLVATLLQAGITQILDLRPQSSRTYDLANPDYAGLREYSVGVTIKCSYASLIQVLGRIGSRGSFFALRAIRIEQSALEPNTLRVEMTCGACVLSRALPLAEADAADSETQDPAAGRRPRRREEL